MATFVSLDAARGAPLHRQLYASVKRAIVEGHWRAGRRVPSTRMLAEQLDLSRNTVMNAFEALLAEGYLVGRVGSGTYVAGELPEQSLVAARKAGAKDGSVRPALGRVSARGAALAATPSPFLPAVPEPSGMAFRLGTPALDRFPVEVWGRLLAQRWAQSGQALVRHTDVQGYAPLRNAIADYVTTARGVRCTADQVIVVSGTQQAMTLAVQVLLKPGDAVWVEDPGYTAGRGVLVAASASVVPVPVDAGGMEVATGMVLCGEARLAMVTPAHQFPLGGSLAEARRAALLEWAQRRGGWVFEDDYDSEFRYVGRPLAALQGMDREGRVIYAGTFSKVLSPSLRLAYLVVPRAVLPAFIAAKAFADVRSPVLEQAVLADFIAEGHFGRHIRRMRVLYARKQELLLASMRRELEGAIEIEASPAGMHLVGWLGAGKDERDEQEAARRAVEAGVLVAPLSTFRLSSRGRGALLLGYAAVPEQEIEAAVRRLAEALR